MRLRPRNRRRTTRRDERGVALLAALMCVIVVISLSVVAVQQSVGSLSGLAQSRKTLQTVDAAEAGLQYEINAVRTHAASSPGTAFNCPVGKIPVTLSQSTASTLPQPNIADPASVGYYSLSVAIAPTQPAEGTTTACTGSVTVPTPSAQNQWYALIKSQGTTSAISGGPVAGRTLEALVKVDANQVVVTTTVAPTSTTTPPPTTLVPAYGAMGNFTEALYALTSLDPGGSFALTDPAGNANAFTTGPLVCGNSNVFQGVVQAYSASGTGNEASGACQVKGSLYVNGPVALTTGAALYQNVYSTGAVDLNGGFTISGNVYANGNVTVSGGATVNGTIYANGSVTLNGGTKVNSNIFAVGNVAVGVSRGGVTVSGTIESQTGNISYAGTGSSGAAYVSPGHTVTPCPKNSAGPTSCTYTLPGDFPNNSVFPVTASLPAAPPFPALKYSATAWQQGGYTTITNNNCNADSGNSLDPAGVYKAIVTAAAGSTPTVVRTTCQLTWGDDYRKGYSLDLHSNLALIADGGFNFTTAMNGVSSADGSPHNFFMIVPTQTDAGATNTTSGGTTCAGNTGNIVFSGNLDTPATATGPFNVHDFLYTPNSVCPSGSTNLDGKVYAGGQFLAGGGYTHQWYDINPYGQTGTTGVPVTTTVPPVTNYVAHATAQALDLAVLGGSPLPLSNPPTHADYAGTGSGSAVTSSATPAVSVGILGTNTSWLSVALLSEYAQANPDASSSACAGALAAGDTLSGTSCSVTGAGTNGLSVDISNLPGLGALSAIADLKLTADAATADASEAAGAIPVGHASFLNAKVVVHLVSGLLNITLAITIPSTPNFDVLSAITSTLNATTGLNKTLLTPLINTLTTTITPLLSLKSDYQNPTPPTAGGLFAVSGLHVALIGTAAVADIALVTVGPNSATAAPTTTTTTSTTLAPASTTTIPPGVTVVWIKQV